MVNMDLPFPFDTRDIRLAGGLTEPAYTYALRHVPSGRVHFGATDNVRKAANMWAKRLRDPNGNPAAPRAFMKFAWVPEDWVLKVGKPYPTLNDAAAMSAAGQSAARQLGIEVTNMKVWPSEIRPAPRPSTVCKGALYYPETMPLAQQHAPWPELLAWLLTLQQNMCPNPSDAQVRALWEEYHNRQEVEPPPHVYDPDRQKRRDKAERVRQYVRNAREVRAGLRPRTWTKPRARVPG
jgi:hypothetical protein